MVRRERSYGKHNVDGRVPKGGRLHYRNGRWEVVEGELPNSRSTARGDMRCHLMSPAFHKRHPSGAQQAAEEGGEVSRDRRRLLNWSEVAAVGKDCPALDVVEALEIRARRLAFGNGLL